MRRALFIAFFNLTGCFGLLAQDIQLVKEYADKQFEKENFSIALKEYQRILLFDVENQYNDIYAKIASIYYQNEDFDNALVYFDFARKAVQNDSLKLEFAFKKTLCYFKQEKYLLGLTELYDFPNLLTPYFENKKNLYFAICHFGLNEHAETISYFSEIVDSTGLNQIDTYLIRLNKYQKKYDPDKLEMMSIFLPGLGQAYAGDVGSALNSLLLLTGIAAYSYYTMVTYSILDGTLVLTTWFYRYYSGGHRKAYELGTHKIQEKRSATYHQILETVMNNPLN